MAKKSEKQKTEYEVGYGKPPKANQFKKGQSGNKKGRPKRSKNLKTDVLEILKAPITVSENGKRKTVSTQKAVLLQIREHGFSGNAKAMDKLVALAREYNNDEWEKDASTPLSASDAEIIERALKRRIRSEQAQEAEQAKRKREAEEEWNRSGLADDDVDDQWLK